MSIYKYDSTNQNLIPVEASSTDMAGATSQSAGTHGLVPAPSAGDEGKFLKGDGTWDKAAADDNYVGTFAAWSLLSDEVKAQYKTCDFTDDEGNVGLGLHVVNGQLYCRYKVVTND